MNPMRNLTQPLPHQDYNDPNSESNSFLREDYSYNRRKPLFVHQALFEMEMTYEFMGVKALRVCSSLPDCLNLSESL